MSNIRILESLSNLQAISSNIQAVKAEWKKLRIDTGNPVDADLMWYSIIRLCIANDEFEILDQLAKDDVRLRTILTVVKPALDEVKRYKKGMRLFRNKALAHFNRDNAGNYQPMEVWMASTARIPRSKGEQEFIYNCLDMAVNILINGYKKEYLNFQETRLVQMHNAIVAFSKGAELRKEVIIDDIAEEINKKGIELGLSIEGHPIVERHPHNDLPPKKGSD